MCPAKGRSRSSARRWGYSLTEVTPEQQAGYVLRSLVVNGIAGVPLSIWYEWRDSVSGSDDKNREAHFGLRDYDDNDKLSAETLKALLPHLADARIEKRLPTGNDKIYSLLLRHPDGLSTTCSFGSGDQGRLIPSLLQ